MADTFNGGSNRSHALRSAMSAVDEMDLERKELAAQHKARKRLLISELGVSPAQFDVMRKLSKLEPTDATDAIRDAYSLIAPGQTVNWLDVMGEPEQPPASAEPVSDYAASAKRRGRPPGSRNRPKVVVSEIVDPETGEITARVDERDDLDDMLPG
jgi:hypothetical protein